MAQLLKTATIHPKRGRPSGRGNGGEAVEAETKSEPSCDQAHPEDTVIFTSHDGTVREISGLPPDLGRATALASEKSLSKVWGTPEEEAACHAMREGI